MLRFRGQRGQSLLEFALLAPFVLFFLLALVDFGIAIDRRIVLDHAVREGARYASVGGQALTSGTPATVAGVMTFTDAQAQGIPDSVVVCYIDQNGGGYSLGDTVKVTTNYNHSFVTGFGDILGLSLGNISMNANASARAEYAIAGVPACT